VIKHALLRQHLFHGAVRLTVLALAAAGLTACSSGTSTVDARSGTAEPVILTPLSTSVQTSDGTWATVPMGHLDQPLNTFWQLLFRPTGTDSWSNHVEATATATNGGLVLASAGGPSLLVGVRPSNLLAFSPLIVTADEGRSWSNGLLSDGLAAHPDALAVGPTAKALALVGSRNGEKVLESTNDLSKWQTLTTEHSLASSTPGRTCRLGSITAVAYLAAFPVVGATCSRPGVVGMFSQSAGSWHLVGPALPASLHSDTVEVVALRSTKAGLSTLLAVSDKSATSLVAAWTTTGNRWSVSRPLHLGAPDQVASFGPATGDGFFVLLSEPSGSKRLEVLGGPGSTWLELPAPPAGTATVAFGPRTTVEALAVNDTTLTVWTLASNPDAWVRGQITQVPIQFGSSG